MKTVLLLSLVISLELSIDEAISAYQIVKREGTTWVGLKPDQTVQVKGYEVTEKVDPATRLRKDYVKRDTDKVAIMFYTHQRAVEITLGHTRRLLLVNDNEATKSNKVVVINLDTNKAEQIDRPAMEAYDRKASPGGRVWVVPYAYAFSPDDRQVLIKMELVDISASTAEESYQVRKSYKQWWYAVDSNTGKVRREYREARVPKRWWVY